MTALQKVNLGTAPAGTDGDPVRAAFVKANANVDVLATQIPLTTTYLPDANTTLDATYVGKRVGVLMTVAGRTVVLPRASTIPSDQCILLWNLGPAVTIGFQGPDGSELNQLNSGDWVIYVSDGNVYWHVQQRGKNAWNETVGGSLSVGGSMSAAGWSGNLIATGKVSGVNSPNLLLNGSGEFVGLGWQSNNFGSVMGGAGEGSTFLNSGAISSPAVSVVDVSNVFSCLPGAPLVISGECYSGGMSAGSAQLDCVFYDSGMNLLGYSPSRATFPSGSGQAYNYKWVTFTTPANTAYVAVRKYCDGNPVAVSAGVRFRRIKLEAGTVPSFYSQEASLAYLQTMLASAQATITTQQASINWLAGSPALTGRPSFAGATPWDSANLVGPARLGTASTFTAPQTFYGTGAAYNTCPLLVSNPSAGFASMGFANQANGAVIRHNTTGGYFELMNTVASAYIGLTCLSVTQTSDKDLKTDIATIPSVMARLRTKRIVSYRMKAAAIDTASDRVHYGAIAQEWQRDFPELVVETAAEIDGDGDFIAHQYDKNGVEIFGPNGKPDSRRALGFDYSGAAAVALAGLIETDVTIAEMRQRIDKLESSFADVLAKAAT